LLHGSNLDVVFTRKGERTVGCDPEDHHSRRHTRAVAKRQRHDTRDDQNAAAWIYAESAQLNVATLDRIAFGSPLF